MVLPLSFFLWKKLTTLWVCFLCDTIQELNIYSQHCSNQMISCNFLLENSFQRRERKKCRWKRSMLALSTSMEMSTSRWLPMICAWWSTLLSMSTDSATVSQSGSMRGRRKSVPLHIRAHSSLPERFPFGCKSKPLTCPVFSFCVSVQFWMLFLPQEGWNLSFSGTDLSRLQEKNRCCISFLWGKGFKPVGAEPGNCWRLLLVFLHGLWSRLCTPPWLSKLEWAWESPEGAGWASKFSKTGVFQQPLHWF